MTSIVAGEIFTDAPNRGGAQLTSVLPWVDAAGDLFVGWLQAYVDPQNTIYRIRKYHDGAQVGEWDIIPPGGYKADSGSYAPSGADLVVTLTAHGSGDPRPLDISVARVVGVFAPYHAGDIPEGQQGAVLPIVGDTGGGMTLTELVAALQDPHSDLSAAIDVHIKNNSQIGSERAVDTQGVLRTGSTDAEKYSILSQNVRDRAYEAIVSYFGPKK